MAKTHVDIFLLDNHKLFREGLVSLLEREIDMNVVGAAADGPKTIKAFRELANVDVCILDIGLKVGSGLDIIPSLRALHSHVKILVLSVHEPQHYALRASDAGADGYITKGSDEADADHLIAAIRRVAAGGKAFDSGSQEEFIRERTGERTRIAHDALSPREFEVMMLTARGATVEEAAKTMMVESGTINSFKRRIARKLGLESAKQITRYVYENGLIVDET